MMSSGLGESPTSEAINGLRINPRRCRRTVCVQRLRTGVDVVKGRRSAHVEGFRTEKYERI